MNELTSHLFYGYSVVERRSAAFRIIGISNQNTILWKYEISYEMLYLLGENFF